MKFPRKGKTVMLAGALTCVVFVVAVGTGMRVPGLHVLSGIGPPWALDYGRFPSRVSPLSAEFISKVLGLPATPDRPEPASLAQSVTKPRSEGDVVRTVVEHALTNDDFEHAYRVSSVPFTARTNASQASRQEAEPNDCSPVGDRTIWYRYRPDRDVGLIANTIGTKQSMSLAVFKGNRFGNLTQVEDACHTSVRGSAYVTFIASKGVTYYFQLTEVTAGGPLQFNLDPLGTTDIASVSSDERQGDSSSMWSAISASGRFVAFSAGSSDLVGDDTNDVEDVFVRDLVTGTTERVSVDSEGNQGNGQSKPWPAAISADGRFVAFTSEASNLVPDDTNDSKDAFVHDRMTRETTRVSVSSSGTEGRKPVVERGDPVALALGAGPTFSDDLGSLGGVSISADGRFVVFDSDLTGLVRGDGPGAEDETVMAGRDVFVHDRLTRKTTLVSASTSGENGNAMSYWADISADGSSVAFLSAASNLVPGDVADANPWLRELTVADVFVRDLRSGRTERVSVNDGGEQGDGLSFAPAISAEGRYVAFASVAANLVPGDENREGIDVFVRDRVARRTELVSRATDGEAEGEQQVAGETFERGRLNSPKPAISWDGRYVVFHSDAPNLVPGDTDESGNTALGSPICALRDEDIFVRDRQAGTTTRVSVSTSGAKGNGGSVYPSISADGRSIAFWSAADNLVAEDRGSEIPYSCARSTDVFVHTFPVLR